MRPYVSAKVKTDGIYLANYLDKTASINKYLVGKGFNNYASAATMFEKTSETGNYTGLIAGQLLYCIAYSSFVFAVSLFNNIRAVVCCYRLPYK